MDMENGSSIQDPSTEMCRFKLGMERGGYVGQGG